MSGPHPAVARVRLAVRRALADVPDGGLVLVACSGGADSLALAAATAFTAPRLGLRAGAVTVDHGLQAASADAAQRAAAQCRALGLAPVEVRTVAVAGTRGPEAAARDARYAALEEAARDHGAHAVLLGHTLDDQAETVLLGLARGSGARSLAGMAPRRGRWWRPLLEIARADTEAACRAERLAWVEDATNELDGPWRRADGGPLRRSAVRHAALPALREALGEAIPANLARTAAHLRRDADLLDTLADEAATDAGLIGDAAVSLDIAVLAEQHPAIRSRVLHRAALAAGCPPGAVSHRHVEALEALVADYRGQGEAMLPGGVTAFRRCGRLNLRRE